MRLPVRSAAVVLLAIAVATCSDAPSLAPRPALLPGTGRFALAPVFSQDAAAVFAQRSLFADVTFDHVHIVLVRPPSEVVKDTTIAFTPGSPAVTLVLNVPVRNVGESFAASIDFVSLGTPIFHGTATVRSEPTDEAVPTAQEIVVNYVGPGATTTRLVVSPKTSSLEAPRTATFTAAGFDAAGNAVSGVPISWESSDPTVATINPTTGLLTTTGKRGSITVTARTPNRISDNASVTVTLPATGITLVSGGGQTGKAGAALAQPAVVRVVASDGVGVAGVAVNFAAPSGGSVGSASATTDANGQASSTLTLGTVVGPQGFAAAAGGFSVSIPATATAADASTIIAVSGGGQSDTVRRALKAPFVAKVTDRFGNAVNGVAVTWARTAGTGTLGGATSTTSGDGTASIGYTLGSTVGTETVTATASGIASPATFSVTALSSGPAAIAAVSGSGQTGRATQALGAPFVVRVSDDQGNPVSGASVSWAPTNGTFPTSTTTTDAQGQSSNTMTLGGTVGAASATATSGGKSVTFTATVQAGVVAQLVFRATPPNALPGAVLTPAVQLELRDAGGNRTTATNAVTIALGANPSGAVLSGTLTRASVGGVATFDDLKLDKVGTGYTLVASSAGPPNVTSAPFNITGPTTPPASITLVDGVTFAPLPPSPPPSVVMTAGVAPTNPPAIKVADATGTGVAGATLSYAVTRAGTPIFGGTATSDAQGLVTFAALLISPANLTVAGNYIFTATLTGTTGSPINLPVTVVPAAPAKYLVTTPTATPLPGSATTITAQLVDQYNNAIATPTPRTVTWGLTGGGSLGAASSTTNTAGQATIVYTAPSAAGGTSVITATDPTTASITGQVTLTPTGPGTPSKLRVVSQPSPLSTPNRATIGPIVVQLVDAGDIAVATPGILVSTSLQSGPTGGTLSTQAVNTTASGQATFNTLALQGPVGTYVIAFTATGLTPTTLTFTNTPGAATQLAFTQPPVTSSAGGTMQPVVVAIRDVDNNVVTSATTSVTLAILSGTGTSGAVLGGTTTAAAVNGLAMFSNLTIDVAGTGYQLTAKPVTTSITSATSPTFDVVAGPDNFLVVTLPSTVANDVVWSPQPAVRLARGTAPVPLAGVTVTLTVFDGEDFAAPRSDGVRRQRPRLPSAKRMNVTVVGNTAVTDANGVATFSGLKVTGPLQVLGLNFSATVAGEDISNDFGGPTMIAGPATSIVKLMGDGQVGTINAPLPINPTIQLVDVSGNTATAPATSVTFTPLTGSGAASPSPVTTNSGGQATTVWTMPGTTGAKSLNASVTIAGVPTTVTFSATAATVVPSDLVVVGTGLSTTAVGTPLSAPAYPRVRVVDAGEVGIPNVEVRFTAAGACSVPTPYASVNTDVNGEAVLAVTAGQLTLPVAAPGSCQVLASTPGVSNQGLVNVVIASPAQKTWTGANSSDWSDAASWLPSGVPTSTSDVFIPSYARNITRLTTGSQTIAALTVEGFQGQVLNIFSNTLTINGSLSAGAAGGLYSSSTGVVILNASSAATMSGFIGLPIRFGPNAGGCATTYTLSGVIQTYSAILNCPVNVGTAVYNVAGSFVVQNQGRLIMNQPGSALITSSDATFQGVTGEAGSLTEGSITIGANLNINNAGSNTPFVQGPNATLIMGSAGTRFINVSTGVTLPVALGSFSIGPNNTVTINSGASFSLAGGFANLGSLTVGNGVGVTVAGASVFSANTATSVLGSMTLNGTSIFSSNATVTGTGTMTVVPVQCTKQSTASVSVTGSTPAFTASPSQCINQVP